MTHLGGFFIKRKLDSSAGKDVLYRRCLHEVCPLPHSLPPLSFPPSSLRLPCSHPPLSLSPPHQYMERVLQAGENVEFFIEGSRSRSGKPSCPKAGLLSVVVDTVKNGEAWAGSHDQVT